MQPSICDIYGLPKLIELVNKKSPGYTFLLFLSPSGLIFSFVCTIYFPSLATSPILIQFMPSSASVKNAFIGLGDPPR